MCVHAHAAFLSLMKQAFLFVSRLTIRPGQPSIGTDAEGRNRGKEKFGNIRAVKSSPTKIEVNIRKSVFGIFGMNRVIFPFGSINVKSYVI